MSERINKSRRYGRLNRLKWVLLITCGIVAIVWGISLLVEIDVGWTRSLNLSDGQFWLLDGDFAERSVFHVWIQKHEPESFGLALPKGFFNLGIGAKRLGSIPLWLLFIPLGFLTVLLFYRDYGFPVHCCRHCGYDLTGNISGRCPECGTEVANQKTTH